MYMRLAKQVEAATPLSWHMPNEWKSVKESIAFAVGFLSGYIPHPFGLHIPDDTKKMNARRQGDM